MQNTTIAEYIYDNNIILFYYYHIYIYFHIYICIYSYIFMYIHIYDNSKIEYTTKTILRHLYNILSIII